MIITERNSAPISPAAIKASAGALEHISIAKTGSLPATLKDLKNYGFWIVGTDSNSNNIYTEELYDKPVAIIIGSEGKGIRPSNIKHCDHLIKIPMKGKINSLNASVSAGVILFEIMRQKQISKS
jgi:23S rRNA (guanosine2251-2'-O)-methyltransferase